MVPARVLIVLALISYISANVITDKDDTTTETDNATSGSGEIEGNDLIEKRQGPQNATVPDDEPEPILRNWATTKATLKQTLIRTFLIVGRPLIGHPLGILFAWISAVEAENAQSIWDQIKYKVEDKIHQELAEYHFPNLQVYWDQMKDDIGKADPNNNEEYTLADLRSLRSKKSIFFPQTNIAIGFSYQYCPAVAQYFRFLNAAFLDLLERNKVTEDDYCEEQQHFRAEVVMAAKALHKKRYRTISGTDWGADKNWIGSFSGGAWLSYNDNLKSQPYDHVYFGDIKKDVFGKIQKATTDMIMKEMVDPVNEFFKPEFCGNCCPQPISRAEIDFEYEEACFGKIKHRQTLCHLPCFDYNSKGKYDWCMYWQPASRKPKYGERKLTTFGTSEKHDYKKCDRQDWTPPHGIQPENDHCMKIEKTTNPYRIYGRKKRAKKGKKNTGKGNN